MKINYCPTGIPFLKDFKRAVHLTQKVDCKSEKSKYRPTTISPNISEIYERLLNYQVCTCLDKYFLKYQHLKRLVLNI